MVLLTASIIFYSALETPYLLAVLLLVTVMTYYFAIFLDQTESPKYKRALLWSGIGCNLLILIFMKYLPFLADNLNSLTNAFSLDIPLIPIKIFVAIGVSYFIFQAISYLIDVYIETEKPERHFGYFALYLSFFPKLLQGPIERADDLIPQLKARYEFNYDNVRSGMFLFSWGLFKKVAIADRLGVYVDAVYGNVHDFTGLPLLLATYAFAFQIYMDFSAYTDMALGTARMFNINLTQNFNSPYLATSVADFWRRWHISLSRWIFDYIFKPLQMYWRNGKSWGTAAALIITFLISGIWHGAGWGFVAWGGYHGILLACSVFYRPYQKQLHKMLGIEKTKLVHLWQIFVTFNLICAGWILFMFEDFKDAIYVFKNIFNMNNFSISYLQQQNTENILLTLSLILFVTYYNKSIFEKKIHKFPAIVRWPAYYVLIASIIYFSIDNKATKQFIYFQF